MAPVKYDNEFYYCTPIRSRMVTYVIFANADKVRIVILFGSKRIRDAFEVKLDYKILKFVTPTKRGETTISFNNSDYHKYLVRVEPFLIELEFTN